MTGLPVTEPKGSARPFRVGYRDAPSKPERNLLPRSTRLKLWTKEKMMTPKRILVPLKGTPGDERVLAMVAPAATAVGATLRLLHVAPVPHNLVSESGRVVMYSDQEMGRLDAQWSAYLAAVAVPLHDNAVECVVRFGDPAPEIVAEAEAWGAELIAMTVARPRRFGWRGLRRIAKAVSRAVRIPVLLYQVS
jgi:nucleotide-binding universal stress UspA family protein